MDKHTTNREFMKSGISDIDIIALVIGHNGNAVTKGR